MGTAKSMISLKGEEIDRGDNRRHLRSFSRSRAKACPKVHGAEGL